MIGGGRTDAVASYHQTQTLLWSMWSQRTIKIFFALRNVAISRAEFILSSGARHHNCPREWRPGSVSPTIRQWIGTHAETV